MDYHAFLATLERYNGAVENSMMNILATTAARRLTKVRSMPFASPRVHHTMGGVTINTDGGAGRRPAADPRRLRRR